MARQIELTSYTKGNWTFEPATKRMLVPVYTSDATGDVVATHLLVFFYTMPPQELDAQGIPIPYPKTWRQMPPAFKVILDNIIQAVDSITDKLIQPMV